MLVATAAVVLLRVAFELVGLLTLALGTRVALQGDWMELERTGTDIGTQLLSMWQRWDALWYQHIVEQGYASGDGSTAFFPLYPLLVRGATFVLAGNDVLASLVVSTVATIGAVALLFKLAEFETGARQVGERPERSPASDGSHVAPALTVLLVLLFPTSFFLFAPYTEGLFLALTVAALFLSRKGRHVWAGAVGGLASLTRAQGALLALPLAYEYARQRGLLPWDAAPRKGRTDVSALGVLLPLVGIFAFGQYIGSIGERRSALEVLALWGYRVVPPWEAAAASVAYISRRAGGDIELLNLISLVGAAVLAVIGWRRLPRAYSLYALASVGVLAVRQMYFSPLMSVARYVLVIFPCFMVLALVLSEHRALAVIGLATSALLLLMLFIYFVQWGFVG